MEAANPYQPHPQLPRAKTISPSGGSAGQSYQYHQQHTPTPQQQQQQQQSTEQQQFSYATRGGGQPSNDAYQYPHQQIQQIQQQQEQQQISPQQMQQMQQQQLQQPQIQQQQIQQQHIQQQHIQQQQQVHQRQLSQPCQYSRGVAPSQQQPAGIHTNDNTVYASQFAQQNQDHPNHDAPVPANSPLHQQPQQSIHVSIPPQLPPGWDAHWDQTHQRYYYHNAALGQTTWEPRE
ncbi:hypothetical protein K440DRAFT_317222 [Wilcoxina mikolae CBS 423.85]|nr:hypothetical protein K440DRAFT_317222 [Wilcoxina mikolae CBS 423.85]